MTNRYLLAAASAALLVANPATAATTVVDFAFVNSGVSLATGSFSFDAAKTGALTYADLDSFTLALPNETYDLAFVNSGNFSEFYYFGYDATLGSFQTNDIGGFPQILSAIKSGFSDGFFVRNDPAFTLFRNYNPESGAVRFTNVTISSRTIDGAVPEPGTWIMMILGFGALGGAMRTAKGRQRAAIAFG
jgi:hypothetical protein